MINIRIQMRVIGMWKQNKNTLSRVKIVSVWIIDF